MKKQMKALEKKIFGGTTIYSKVKGSAFRKGKMVSISKDSS
jgi:hypothetical protein